MNVSFDLLIDTNLVTTVATIDALLFSKEMKIILWVNKF